MSQAVTTTLPVQAIRQGQYHYLSEATLDVALRVYPTGTGGVEVKYASGNVVRYGSDDTVVASGKHDPKPYVVTVQGFADFEDDDAPTNRARHITKELLARAVPGVVSWLPGDDAKWHITLDEFEDQAVSITRFIDIGQPTRMRFEVNVMLENNDYCINYVRLDIGQAVAAVVDAAREHRTLKKMGLVE